MPAFSAKTNHQFHIRTTCYRDGFTNELSHTYWSWLPI